MKPGRIADLFQQLESATALSLPKYLRVCETLLKLIELGELQPGDKVPTEADITAALPVSLGTVQKALSTLTEKGVLVRLQGSGTFVAKRESELGDLWHFRFINSDGKKILPVFTKVLSIDNVRDPGPWTAFLGKEKDYIRITREIDVNHEFKAIGQFFLSSEQYGELLDYQPSDLEGVHLRNVIRDKFGKPTIQVRERVVAETFPDAVCSWLGVPFYSMGLVCHILGYTHKDAPLSFQQLFVPPNVRPLEIREKQPS